MSKSDCGDLGVKWRLGLMLALGVFPAHAKDVPVFDPAADPAVLATHFVKADKMKALAGIKRVAIAQFRVEFAVENDASASSSGNAGWTSSKADIKLVGVTDEARQAIADALQDKLVQDLTAAGIEVVPYETVRESAGYKSIGPVMHTGQQVTGTRTGKSVFVGAKGAPYYMTNDDKHLGLGTMLGGMSTTQPQNYEPQIAKALDAAVLRVTLMLAFSDQTHTGGMFNNSSSVKTAARLAFIPELSQVLFITPNSGKARVYLNETVLVEGGAIELKETTTGGEKATQAVANVVTGLLGGGVRSEKHFEASTTDQAYLSAVSTYGLAVESAWMNAIRAGLTLPP